MGTWKVHRRTMCTIFSPRRTFMSMFKRNDTRQQYSGYEILDFLRSLSVLWVVCLHQENQWILQDWFDRPKFSEEEVLWWNGFLWSGHFSVDLFLLISGFLIGMIIIREQKKYERRVNLRRFYYRRALRIYPLLLVNFGVYYAVEAYLLNDYRCRDNWWATIFYVNNIPQIINYSETCMLWTWSLALEVQFYVIISLILAATPNKLGIHKAVCWFVVFGTSILRMVIALDIGALFPPAISEFGGDNRWSFELYIPAYTRMGNLFIGTLTAIYEMEEKDKEEARAAAGLGMVEKDDSKWGKAKRWGWNATLVTSLIVVLALGLVNWSAVLDKQCLFLDNCGCNDIPLHLITDHNATCSKPLDQCTQYLRLSENCGNVWLPEWFQIFLLATYRTIFCVAWGIIVYYVLLDSNRRRAHGLKPTWYLRFFANPFWFFIAQISYGIYLWNQMLIYVVQLAFFDNIFTDNLHTSFIWKMLVLAACIFFTTLFAIVTYVLVEKPFMDIRDYSKYYKKEAEKVRAARVMSVKKDGPNDDQEFGSPPPPVPSVNGNNQILA